MRPLPSPFSLLRFALLSGVGALFGLSYWASYPSLSPSAAPTATKTAVTKVPLQKSQEKALVVAPSSPALASPIIPLPPTPQDKLIRVGLSTSGGSIQLWSRLPLVIRDTAQPGLVLLTKAQDKITITKTTPSQKPVTGKANAFYKGPLQIRTGAGVSGAWQSVLIYAAAPIKDEFIRLTSDGAHAKWGRPYRGMVEIAPMAKPFDALKYKGVLRVVNVVEMEEYLKGVVPWEMNPEAPLEALKAQAICARSNLLAKMGGKFKPFGFDVTDYDNCQGYPGAANEKPSTTLAVEQTKGKVLFYKGRIADAVYGTNSGGLTASSEDVWAGRTPYLRGVRDFSPKRHSSLASVIKPQMSEEDWAAYCSQNLPAYAQPDTTAHRQLASRRATSRRVAQLFQESDLPEFYRWSRYVSAEDLAKAVATQFKNKMAIGTEIRVLERAPSGHIKRLAISGDRLVINSKPTSYNNSQPIPNNKPSTPDSQPPITVVLQGDSQIRSMLTGRMGSTTALPSSTFVALPQKDVKGTVIGWILKGAGWGHGVGMCQRGAQNHAREGWNAQRILQHYFTGVEVRKL
jgi:stage II sporulation protein D